jgi:hypothetical protein
MKDEKITEAQANSNTHLLQMAYHKCRCAVVHPGRVWACVPYRRRVRGEAMGREIVIPCVQGLWKVLLNLEFPGNLSRGHFP